MTYFMGKDSFKTEKTLSDKIQDIKIINEVFNFKFIKDTDFKHHLKKLKDELKEINEVPYPEWINSINEYKSWVIFKNNDAFNKHLGKEFLEEKQK